MHALYEELDKCPKTQVKWKITFVDGDVAVDLAFCFGIGNAERSREPASNPTEREESIFR